MKKKILFLNLSLQKKTDYFRFKSYSREKIENTGEPLKFEQ